ncbi:MAG TPA: hypothetical protein VG713_11675 [Pirellulales bacterium]|nr:hypothetical protein [Pirellulales bacterium]
MRRMTFIANPWILVLVLATMGVSPCAAEPSAEPEAAVDTSIVVTVDDPNLAGPRDSIGMSSAAPNLGVQIFGPRRLTIDKGALYTVKLTNPSRSIVEQVLVSIAAPDWAEISDVWASSGFTAEAREGYGYLWRFPAVEPGADHELRLLIVPHKSEALKLDVTWNCAPPVVQSPIQVDEPELRVAIHGAHDVICGRPQLYTVELENVGTGDADNVQVQIAGVNDQRLLASERVELLKPGEKRTLELTLTVRDLGATSIVAQARCGEVSAKAQREIVVRRPQLDLAIAVPRNQYAGSTATAEVAIENPGDASASEIDLVITLPEGATLLSASHDLARGNKPNEHHCRLDEVPAGGSESITLRYKIVAQGQYAIAAQAVAKDNLATAANAPITVVATPNLAIEVVGMPGPIEVGTPTTYLIELRNRGTCATEALELLVSFTDGLDPSAEGEWQQAAPGKISLRPKPIEPGQIATYRVVANPTKAGNHRVRVEAHDRPLGVRLTQEVGTLFYSDAELAPQ